MSRMAASSSVCESLESQACLSSVVGVEVSGASNVRVFLLSAVSGANRLRVHNSVECVAIHCWGSETCFVHLTASSATVLYLFCCYGLSMCTTTNRTRTPRFCQLQQTGCLAFIPAAPFDLGHRTSSFSARGSQTLTSSSSLSC